MGKAKSNYDNFTSSQLKETAEKLAEVCYCQSYTTCYNKPVSGEAANAGKLQQGESSQRITHRDRHQDATSSDAA